MSYTYTKPAMPYDPQSIVIYADAGCSAPAAITINGGAVQNAEILANVDGSWPTFQSVSNPVYVLNHDNVPEALYPTMNFASVVAVTGSRSTATATVLENLIQALITVGVPISDGTTA